MLLTNAANVADPTSLSNRFRNRRFAKFESLVQPRGQAISILDIGGTTQFWEQRGWAGKKDVQIVLFNLVEEEQQYANIMAITGDATNLMNIENNAFDIVFSNSVIEHLFTWEKQQAMADEARRVGRAYWIQTPNFWFPIEPHFHALGWQWWPRSFRIALIQRWRFGQRGPYRDKNEAANRIDEIQLLTERRLRALFPAAHIWREPFLGFTKSLVAFDGFNEIS